MPDPVVSRRSPTRLHDRDDGAARSAGRRPRRRSTFAIAMAGLVSVPLVGLAPAASAVVNAPHQVTVFHNRDMVAAMGYQAGENLKIEVVRGGTVVAVTEGPAANTDEGVGLEVNHGPEGTVADGDCWTHAATPTDIVRPGDTIQVTSGSGVETMVVADVDLTSDPRRVGDSVVISGQGGTAASPPEVELRNDDVTPRLRVDGLTVEYTGATWTATFTPSATTSTMPLEQQRTAALAATWIATVGAEDDPEITMSERGADVANGPADGCPPPQALPNTPPPPPPPPGGGDTQSPSVDSRSPAPDATGVAVGANVSATFNEAVNNVPTNFTLSSASGAVGAQVTRDGTSNTWVLNPNADLAAGTRYTASLGNGITDAAGNPLQAVSWSFTTAAAPPPPPPPPGNTAPTAPANIRASAITNTSLTLTWSPSTDDSGVVDYRVYRNGNRIDPAANSTATSFNVTGLAPGTTYTFEVRAVDAAGLLSPRLEPAQRLTVTTTGVKVTKPSKPRSVKATPGAAGRPLSVVGTWVKPASGSPVSTYVVELQRKRSNGTWVKVASVTRPGSTLRWEFKGLSSGTYRIRVEAKNSAGGSGFAASGGAVAR